MQRDLIPTFIHLTAWYRTDGHIRSSECTVVRWEAKNTNSNKRTCCHEVPGLQGLVPQWVMCPAMGQETEGWAFCRSLHLESDVLAILERDWDEKQYPDAEPWVGCPLILSPFFTYNEGRLKLSRYFPTVVQQGKSTLQWLIYCPSPGLWSAG